MSKAEMQKIVPFPEWGGEQTQASVPEGAAQPEHELSQGTESNLATSGINESRTVQPYGEERGRNVSFKQKKSSMSAFLRRRSWLKRRLSSRSRGIAALNAAACMEGCDDQLLPASFRALETDLRFHPAVLGKITLAQTVAQSFSCPMWGYFADRYPRQRILATGMLAWGITTFVLAFASKLWQVIALRALNGVFLGSIGPIAQSIIADLTDESQRGLQFGLIQLCTSLGRVFGGVVTTTVAHLHFAGLRGWRWTFMAVALLSILLGVTLGLILIDMEAPAADSPPPLGGGKPSARARLPAGPTPRVNFVKHLTGVLRTEFTKHTVIILLVEGVIGTIPWSAMSFLTMYFQYCGMSDSRAGVAAAAVLVGAMISGPVAGVLGDRLSGAFPRHGRPFMGQLAMVLRLPFVYLAFAAFPREADSFALFAAAFFAVGLASFSGVVVIRPLMSDVILPQHRGTAFAIIVACEGAFGTLLGAPMVGLLAEHVFGYHKTQLPVAQLHPLVRLRNADALANALLCLTVLPWTCSLFTFGLLHRTYTRDKEATARTVAPWQPLAQEPAPGDGAPDFAAAQPDASRDLPQFKGAAPPPIPMPY